jgi:two-component system, OmpR family, sensor kinase
MGLVLGATGVFLYLRFESELDSSLNQGLRTRADEVAALVAEDPSALQDSGRTRLTEADESFAQVIGPDGEVLDATPPLDRASALTDAQLERARKGTVLVDRGPPPGLDDPVRLLARPVRRDGRQVVMVVGSAKDDRNDALSSLLTLLLIGGPLALLLASLAGYALASAALRPVESMSRRAGEISRLGTGRRLPVPEARDELAQLGDTLNEMLDRLEASAERERAFVANASHELRTPLTLLRGELELALREGRSADELRAAIAAASDESDRLLQLTEDLLLLARSDEGRLAIRPAELDVEDQLVRVQRRFGARAESAGRELRIDAEGHPRLVADPDRLEQALGNLADNALRHGAGDVVVAAHEDGGAVTLTVTDEGAGFPPEILARAFERFARADAGRTSEGAGLGLAIVQAIATAHGGIASARNRAEGGAEVSITLPAPPVVGGDRVYRGVIGAG